MKFTQIDLRTQYNHKFQKLFNAESWCVPGLYWSFLSDYDTKGVRKCIVWVSDNWRIEVYKYTDWSDNKGINIPFDFERYFKLDKPGKKKMQLSAIHEGMMKIAGKENWAINPLLDAYNKCIEKNLEYKFFVAGKIKSSPNRKYKMSFWCNWDIDMLDLYWILYDKNSNEIKRDVILKTESYKGDFVNFLTFKWKNDETIILKERLRDGEWEFKIN